MKHTILAAAAVMALATPAFAQSQPPGGQLGTATSQPSGGYVSDNVGAATKDLQGAAMGAAEMNGPNRNGQPDSAYPTNEQQANLAPKNDTPDSGH